MSMLSRVRFEVNLKISRVTRIPQSSGRLQVRWHVTDSPRADSRGRTKVVPINDHQSIFDYEEKFAYTLGIGVPSGRLRSGTVVFEVLWEPPGAHKMPLGSITLDLAQFVARPMEPLAFLLENSRVNCLLFLQLSLEQIRGPTNFTLPEFTAPVLKTDIASGIGLGDVPAPSKQKPDIKSAINRSLDKPMYVRWIRAQAQSPHHFNPIDTVSDICKGGDGFGDLGKVMAAPRAENEAATDEELRDNLISWAVILDQPRS